MTGDPWLSPVLARRMFWYGRCQSDWSPLPGQGRGPRRRRAAQEPPIPWPGGSCAVGRRAGCPAARSAPGPVRPRWSGTGRRCARGTWPRRGSSAAAAGRAGPQKGTSPPKITSTAWSASLASLLEHGEQAHVVLAAERILIRPPSGSAVVRVTVNGHVQQQALGRVGEGQRVAVGALVVGAGVPGHLRREVGFCGWLCHLLQFSARAARAAPITGNHQPAVIHGVDPPAVQRIAQRHARRGPGHEGAWGPVPHGEVHSAGTKTRPRSRVRPARSSPDAASVPPVIQHAHLVPRHDGGDAAGRPGCPGRWPRAASRCP